MQASEDSEWLFLRIAAVLDGATATAVPQLVVRFYDALHVRSFFCFALVFVLPSIPKKKKSLQQAKQQRQQQQQQLNARIAAQQARADAYSAVRDFFFSFFAFSLCARLFFAAREQTKQHSLHRTS